MESSKADYETAPVVKLVNKIIKEAFGSSQFKFGYAAAIAWCLFLIIVLISIVNFLLVRRIRSAES